MAPGCLSTVLVLSTVARSAGKPTAGGQATVNSAPLLKMATRPQRCTTLRAALAAEPSPDGRKQFSLLDAVAVIGGSAVGGGFLAVPDVTAPLGLLPSATLFDLWLHTDEGDANAKTHKERILIADCLSLSLSLSLCLCMPLFIIPPLFQHMQCPSMTLLMA